MQWLDAEQEPTIFAVEAPKPRFGFASGAPHPYCTPALHDARAVIGMDSVGPPRIQSLVKRKARIVKASLIEELRAPVGSSSPHQRRDGVDDESEAVFGFLDLIKCALQRGFNPLL